LRAAIEFGWLPGHCLGPVVPLLRSVMVRRFPVGFEMLAMPQRDITPYSSSIFASLVDITSASKVAFS
jgi:hypothetical protein